jgi:glucokinase
MVIIASDVGGTKTNLAIFDEQKDTILLQSTFSSKDHSNFTEIVVEFCKQFSLKVTAAVFAIAGPIEEGVCRATNLPWVVSTEELQKVLGIKKVRLINDLEANAYALEILSQKDLYILQQGKAGIIGNRAVISPGTGLGEAGLYYDGTRHHPFPSEGGHSDFAPCNDIQLDLCRYLLNQFGHASYERLLSGPGLHNIYLFLKENMHLEEPSWLEEKIKKEDPSRVISEEALKGSSEICTTALDLFIAILGAEAGNCALKFLARGGVYLGGGIPPKILPKFQEPTFLTSFLNKGRFQSFLKEIPIAIILNDKASLLGAYHYSSISGLL